MHSGAAMFRDTEEGKGREESSTMAYQQNLDGQLAESQN